MTCVCVCVCVCVVEDIAMEECVEATERDRDKTPVMELLQRLSDSDQLQSQPFPLRTFNNVKMSKLMSKLVAVLSIDFVFYILKVFYKFFRFLMLNAM